MRKLTIEYGLQLPTIILDTKKMQKKKSLLDEQINEGLKEGTNSERKI